MAKYNTEGKNRIKNKLQQQKKKRKREKNYAFRRQFDEKPSIIPGCPDGCNSTPTCSAHELWNICHSLNKLGRTQSSKYHLCLYGKAWYAHASAWLQEAICTSCVGHSAASIVQQLLLCYTSCIAIKPAATNKADSGYNCSSTSGSYINKTCK